MTRDLYLTPRLVHLALMTLTLLGYLILNPQGGGAFSLGIAWLHFCGALALATAIVESAREDSCRADRRETIQAALVITLLYALAAWLLPALSTAASIVLVLWYLRNTHRMWCYRRRLLAQYQPG